jgi:signal peptide peptidase SppA
MSEQTNEQQAFTRDTLGGLLTSAALNGAIEGPIIFHEADARQCSTATTGPAAPAERIEPQRYRHVARMVAETPWALHPAKLQTILDLLAFRIRGGVLSAEEIRERIGAVSRPESRTANSVAVLPLFGVISQRANLMSASSGGTSIERFTEAFRAALADPSVGAILLDVDSPGGGVFGVEELASEIYRARGTKPITAIANAQAASAAYWIASAAEELVVTPSGEVGSIGVYAAHTDLSAYYEREGIRTTLISAGKFKVEGNQYEPLAEEGRAAIQERVDDYYRAFTAAVARHRGVGVEVVRGGFGEGRMVGAQRAKAEGMVDRVATFDEVLGDLMRATRRRSQARAEERRRVLLAAS